MRGLSTGDYFHHNTLHEYFQTIVDIDRIRDDIELRQLLCLVLAAYFSHDSASPLSVALTRFKQLIKSVVIIILNIIILSIHYYSLHYYSLY